MYSNKIGSYFNNDKSAWPLGLEYIANDGAHKFALFHHFDSLTEIETPQIHISQISNPLYLGVTIGEKEVSTLIQLSRLPNELRPDIHLSNSNCIEFDLYHSDSGQLVARISGSLSEHDQKALFEILTQQKEKEDKIGAIEMGMSILDDCPAPLKADHYKSFSLADFSVSTILN